MTEQINLDLLKAADNPAPTPVAAPTPVQTGQPAPAAATPAVATSQIQLSALAGNTASTAIEPVDTGTVAAPVSASVDQQLAALPEAQRQEVVSRAAGVNLLEDGIESSFGSDVQRATSSTADTILERVRSKDSGEAGELLRGMLGVLDKEQLGAVSNVPILGNLLNSANALRRRYQKVEGQLDDICAKLEAAQSRMLSDIAMFDGLYQANAQTYRDLKLTVLAGRKALADFNANQLPGLEAQAAASGDPMDAQLVNDLKAKLQRFDKHLDDLDRVSVIALQTAPQIKIIQNADRTIADKIATTISTTIPVWKSQIVISLGLENQKKALELQNMADDVTNRMITQNAARLHQGAVAAEKANQRGVVDIETLEKANRELIATLQDTVAIQNKGKADREAAQAKMRQMESDLKTALIANAKAMR